MSRPDFKKISQSLNYLAIKEGGSIDYLKAVKLLYLAERLHVRSYGRLITDDKLIGMKKGTLGSCTKDVIELKQEHLSKMAYEYVEARIDRSQITNQIITSCDANADELSESDIECIDKIWKSLGEKSAAELITLTHELPEWKRHKYSIESGERKVVDLLTSDLFTQTDNDELDKIFSEDRNLLEVSKDSYSESEDIMQKLTA